VLRAGSARVAIPRLGSPGGRIASGAERPFAVLRAGSRNDYLSATFLIQELPMQGLVSLGVLLIIAWAVAFVVFKVAGFLIHLLVIVGVIMLLVGFFKRAGRGISSDR